MTMSPTSSLTRQKALIFRITHRDNVPWILDHGLHARTSPVQDPNFVQIGSTDIIARRTRRRVPDPPYGTLANYVPFYFTPLSPMLYNIRTGYGGVPQRRMDEIVIIVSSLPLLVDHGIRFLFTDRHAIYETAEFFSDLADLLHLPWNLLRDRDFTRDPENPGKVESYQAEALVYEHLPIDALLGLVCYTDDVKTALDEAIATRGLSLAVKVYAGWFFQ
jgi:ssDNA thymidine ADP-ribosyltransferase, DarT